MKFNDECGGSVEVKVTTMFLFLWSCNRDQIDLTPLKWVLIMQKIDVSFLLSNYGFECEILSVSHSSD